MKHLHPDRDPDWLEKAVASIRYTGLAVIEGLLSPADCARGIQAIQVARDAIAAEVSEAKLQALRSQGSNELRLILNYHPFFLELLNSPWMLDIIDATLGDKAVLRFQNGEICAPESDDTPALAQWGHHMNTQRVTPGSLLALDIAVMLTPVDMAASPGTHQQAQPPPSDYLKWSEEVLQIPAGAVLAFDATLWHRELPHTSPDLRYLIDQQFTKSYVKPHFDYPRVLGEERMMALPVRTRQLLGWHTRLPASLLEFYLPGEQRLYREGQG